MAQTIYGSVKDAGSALCISAVNLGNRIVNLTYLGVGIIDNGKMRKLALLNGSGDTTSVDFMFKQLLALTDTLHGKVLYAYAHDSEGQEYKKKIGIYDDILNALKP